MAAVITREPGPDGSWRSEPKAWPMGRLAAAVHDPELIVGYRPEGLVRVVTADIDRKSGGSVSPYWHPYGLSRQLQALDAVAEAAGCIATLLRSSESGGLHCWIALPEAVPAWLAHWVAAELVNRAGMTIGPGVCEVFPSRLDYVESGSPADWAQSHGIRLPGQQGSALVAGERMAEDPELIYAELLEALAITEASPAWEELLEAARARQKAHRREQRSNRPRAPRRATTRPHGISWRKAGESHENLRRITRWARAAYPTLTTVEGLAAAIRQAVLLAPGFREHASEATQRDVERQRGGWAERWARSSLRRDRAPGAAAPEGGDKHHNRRLFLRSRAALTRVWRRAADAASWSQRKVAEVSGLSRQTVRHHWDYWLQLVAGTHPSLTGGAGPIQGEARFNRTNQSFSLTPPVTPAVSVAIGVSPPTPPGDRANGSKEQAESARPRWRTILRPLIAAASTGASPFAADAVPLDPIRARQRAELMQWLGAAA